MPAFETKPLFPILALAFLAGCALEGAAPSASGTVSPDLAVYNGEWVLTFASKTEFSNRGIRCEDGTGRVRISNGAVRGRTVIGTTPLVATGTISAGGQVSARFTTDQVNVGDASGQATGDTMSGTFADDFGCSGTWSAARL